MEQQFFMLGMWLISSTKSLKLYGHLNNFSFSHQLLTLDQLFLISIFSSTLCLQFPLVTTLLSGCFIY